MDKIELTVEDIEALLKWRDEHKDEVRSHPAPLKAVEIVIPHSGFRIKGIREGDTLRLHLSRHYEQFGNCTFVRRSDGMWASTKNRTRGVAKEDLQSALTVYCTLMALMAYGRLEPRQEPARRNRRRIRWEAIRMDSQDRAKRLLAIGMGMSLAMGGPYSGLDMKIPNGKPQRGHLVGCHVCGATWGTLYKDGDQRICGECRKKKGAGRDD